MKEAVAPSAESVAIPCFVTACRTYSADGASAPFTLARRRLTAPRSGG